MLYSVVGTHKTLREKAHAELLKFGVVSRHVYSEQIAELESLVDAGSLFGEKVIVSCVQLGDVTTSKEELIRLLPRMEKSDNIFIIDEPFADVHMVNRLTKVVKKLFDTREEKIKDVSVFKLCDSFVARNKKQAWVDFMDVKEREGGESIAGALWWKFQGEWLKVREGRSSLFTEVDCERIGGELVRSTILAHRGERDLLSELERIIISL